MSLNVNVTSSAENGVPSLHFTPLRSLKVQLSPSGAVVQLSARSGAGARSFPGLVIPSKITRLMKSDSTNAFGLHGLRVGSAPIGIVTVPPATGDPGAAVDAPGCGAAPEHADTTSAVASASAETWNEASPRRDMPHLPRVAGRVYRWRDLGRWAPPPAIVHVQDPQALAVGLEPLLESRVVAGLPRRPEHLRHRAEARPRHVLDVPRVRHVLGPKLRLRAKHVFGLVRGELPRDRLVRVNGFERVLPADADRLSWIDGLGVVEVRRLLRRHHHVMARTGRGDPAVLAAPAHHRRAGREPALEDLVPADEPPPAGGEP